VNVAQLTEQLNKVHPRYGLMWRLGVETGLRIGDLLRIRPRDVKRLLRVTEQKTGKKREIDIDSGLRRDLREFIKAEEIKPDEFVFYSRRTDKTKPMSRQWANSQIKKMGAILHFEGLGSHSMRKNLRCK
jgi:integrase